MSEFDGVEIGIKDKNQVEIKCGDKIITDKGFGTVFYNSPSFDIKMETGDMYDSGDFHYGRWAKYYEWDEFEVIK